MDPMKINTADATCIAFVSSEQDGRQRWTELRVWHFDPPLPYGRGRSWMAEARGCSDVEGEVDKVRRRPAGTLDACLKLFDDSDLGVLVKDMAIERAAELGLNQRGQMVLPPVPEQDADALWWLYGNPPEGVSINQIAHDLGVGESKIRAAIKAGRSVNVPLRSLLPFIDRERFQHAMRREVADVA